MRSIYRAALLGATILLLSATTASATTIASTTDEAGNTWQLQTGVLSGGQVREFTAGSEVMRFSVPITSEGIAVDGDVYVSEPFGVKEFSTSGTWMRTFDQGTWNQGATIEGAIIVDRANHDVYVSEHSYVSWWTPEGEDIGGFGVPKGNWVYEANAGAVTVCCSGGHSHKFVNEWVQVE